MSSERTPPELNNPVEGLSSPPTEKSGTLTSASTHSSNNNSARNSIGSGTGKLLNISGSASPPPMPEASIMKGLKPADEEFFHCKSKLKKVTEQKRVSYECEWIIPKFDKAFPFKQVNTIVTKSGIKTRTIESKVFTVGSDIGQKCDWVFNLSDTGGMMTWRIHLIKIHKRGAGAISAAFSSKVVDGRGRPLLEQNRTFQDFTEDQRGAWVDFVELEKLYYKRAQLIPENTLRMRVVLEIYLDADFRDIEAAKQEKQEFSKIVAVDLQRVRTWTGTADVHLECEGKVFPAHKLILSARSPTFASMFEQEESTNSQKNSPRENAYAAIAGGDLPAEAREQRKISTIDVYETPAHILEIILDYIYSGNVLPLTDQEVVSGIIQAADKFQLSDLKRHCFNSLMQFLNEDNVGKLAILAFRHQAEKPVRMSINAFCLRHFVDLMKKKSFRDVLKMEPDAFFTDEDPTL